MMSGNIKMPVNPCYDKKTKQDCEKRKVGCGVNCEEWAKYEKLRNAAYKERKAEYDKQAAIKENVDRCIAIRKQREGRR